MWCNSTLLLFYPPLYYVFWHGPIRLIAGKGNKTFTEGTPWSCSHHTSPLLLSDNQSTHNTRSICHHQEYEEREPGWLFSSFSSIGIFTHHLPYLNSVITIIHCSLLLPRRKRCVVWMTNGEEGSGSYSLYLECYRIHIVSKRTSDGHSLPSIFLSLPLSRQWVVVICFIFSLTSLSASKEQS